MKLEIEETELRNLVFKAMRYDIIMCTLIREKFDKINIYDDVILTDEYMQDIINKQPVDIRPATEDKTKTETESK